LIGIQLEERDLVRRFGDVYLRYRRAVGMLLPVPVVSRKARKVERRAA
jgi:protein-S-isoprenylcysteine O-methyltransferase Ste14